ncbi:FAD-binding protein [Allokutzneria sp. A3M-2-11 16]|uniref:FAD-binding protein n=1 Tax=Allokutzneria sp. A3M-2-11 16 TaxID=2962043 RepID=UPI0020B80899|nr:FAD-binding protein [Allokutzneria sp. A3M-2-11 16]MCP3805101.1 FAD-binding protein [Allokutzneria sp. A3M-2-11 16]
MTDQALYWRRPGQDWASAVTESAVAASVLTGDLFVTGDAVREASRDFGRVVDRRPHAVLRPRTAEDVAKVVRFCHDHRVPLAPQGTGHMTQGQRLVEAGVAVDVTALRTIRGHGPGWVDVDAGVLWSDLVRTLAAAGRRFAGGLTGYLPVSVGGTLSAGGVGPDCHNGAQIDFVERIQIVTGSGDIVWASEREHPTLFNAALGGIGQVGVITRAVLKVTALPTGVRSWVLPYTDQVAAFAVMRELLDRGTLDEVFCVVAPPGTLAPVPTFLLHLAHYEDGAGAPREGFVDGLYPRGPVQEERTDYVSHVTKYSAIMERWQREERWDDCVKPWFDVWHADAVIDSFVGDVLGQMTAEDWSLPHGKGFVLLMPHRAGVFRRSRLRLPQQGPDDWVWLFDVLTSSQPDPDPLFTEKMLRRNQNWLNAARRAGGFAYPVGSQVFTPEDWRHHYGDTWDEVVRTKKIHDPARILTPGPGINAALP